MEERRLIGTWWIPDAPDKRVGGVLCIPSSEKCTVELTGLLYRPGERVTQKGSVTVTEISERDEGPAIIHGAADGRFITLIDPSSSNATEKFGGDCATAKQTLKPRVVIIGLHLETPEDPVFDGIDVEIDNLTAWAGVTGLKTLLDDQYIVSGYKLEMPDSITAEVDGTTISLAWTWKRSAHLQRTLDRNQVYAKESAYARITGSTPSMWNAFHPTMKSLQDLLTLATRHPSAIRSKQLFSKLPDRGTKRFELLHGGNTEIEHERKVVPQDFLFSLQDVSFQDLLDRWVPLYRSIGLGIHVLFGLDYSRSGYYENKLFNAASAAESLHRALFPEATGLAEDQYRQLIQQVEAAISDKTQRHWIKGRLRNDRGYKDRLLDLADIPSAQAVSYLLTDVDVWAKWVRDARNALAHLDSAKLEKIPEEARYRLGPLTSALMHLVLLEKLGVSPEHQLHAAERSYGFAARAFRTAIEEAATKRATHDQS
ncbi:HEPN domain-containing protein [Spirillospora sp. NPDC047279]|uniref:ApeA N-terminal domain 1-containing protein n=1 Tax=Spirillospora sp. NPDC047279 TaxID=3155478 RepID=UPI0033D15DD0